MIDIKTLETPIVEKTFTPDIEEKILQTFIKQRVDELQKHRRELKLKTNGKKRIRNINQEKWNSLRKERDLKRTKLMGIAPVLYLSGTILRIGEVPTALPRCCKKSKQRSL